MQLESLVCSCIRQLWGPGTRFPQAWRKAVCLHNVQVPPAFWICTTFTYSCRFSNCLFNYLFACTITQFGQIRPDLHMQISTWAPTKWLHLQIVAGPIYKPIGGMPCPKRENTSTGLEIQILITTHAYNEINFIFHKAKKTKSWKVYISFYNGKHSNK